jgi:hypothetical protein
MSLGSIEINPYKLKLYYFYKLKNLKVLTVFVNSNLKIFNEILIKKKIKNKIKGLILLLHYNSMLYIKLMKKTNKTN